MDIVTDQETLDRYRQGAVLVMFGGADCSVCGAVTPKIETLIREEFPRLDSIYLDCQSGAAQACAQERIFSIPVVQVWFEGRKFAEFVRVFSISDIRDAIARPYELAFS